MTTPDPHPPAPGQPPQLPTPGESLHPHRHGRSRAEALAEARRRFILLSIITAVATVVALAAGFAWFRATNTPFSGAFVIAVSAGVIGSMMIAAALMGLIFFSATSGADDDADSADF